MTNDLWTTYQDKLEHDIKADTSLAYHLSNDRYTQGTLDLIWDKISSHIKNAAKEIIPNSPSVDRTPKRPKKLADLRPTGIVKATSTLANIIKQVKQQHTIILLNFEIDELNAHIDNINIEYDTDIDLLPYDPDDDWITMAKGQLRFLNKRAHLEELKLRDSAIKNRLVTRAEDTISNQSRMLSSILDKDFRKITIDRLVTVENGIPTLH